jgi:hypothetical protein
VRLTSWTAVKSPKRRVRLVVVTAETMWVKHIREQRPQEEKFVEQHQKREKTSKGRGLGEALRGVCRLIYLSATAICRVECAVSGHGGTRYLMSGLQNRV